MVCFRSSLSLAIIYANIRNNQISALSQLWRPVNQNWSRGVAFMDALGVPLGVGRLLIEAREPLAGVVRDVAPVNTVGVRGVRVWMSENVREFVCEKRGMSAHK